MRQTLAAVASEERQRNTGSTAEARETRRDEPIEQAQVAELVRQATALRGGQSVPSFELERSVDALRAILRAIEHGLPDTRELGRFSDVSQRGDVMSSSSTEDLNLPEFISNPTSNSETPRLRVS